MSEQVPRQRVLPEDSEQFKALGSARTGPPAAGEGSPGRLAVVGNNRVVPGAASEEPGEDDAQGAPQEQSKEEGAAEYSYDEEFESFEEEFEEEVEEDRS